jgi:hypothetical protein
MKTTVTVILAVVAVALGGYFVWTLVPQEKSNLDTENVLPDNALVKPATAREQETTQEIQRLAARKRDEDIPTFKKHLKDESPCVRHAAAKAIIDVGGRDELPTLVEVLKDTDRSVRAGILQFLSKWRDPRLIPHLAELLKTDKEVSVRLLTVDALSRIDDESRIPVLIDALKDKRFVIRKKAHEALQAATSAKVDVDEKTLEDDPEKAHSQWSQWWEQEQVKKFYSHTGVKQLEQRNDADSVKLLVKIAFSQGAMPNSEAVEAAAVASLCRMTCPEAEGSFKKILVDTANEPLCLAAINAIVACKKKDYLSTLKKLATNGKSPEVIRQKSTWAIRHLESSE